jgi:hypothetical protein
MIPFCENKVQYELHGKNDYFSLKNSALHVTSLPPDTRYWSSLSNRLYANSKFEEVGTPYRLSINVGLFYSCGGGRLYLHGTAASNGSIVHLSDVTRMNMEQWWSDNWQGKIEVVYSERTITLHPLYALMAGYRPNFTFTFTYSKRTLSQFESPMTNIACISSSSHSDIQGEKPMVKPPEFWHIWSPRKRKRL